MPNLTYTSDLGVADFAKLRELGVSAKSTMQNAIIKLANGETLVIGINRKKNPHKLYFLTPDQRLKYFQK